MLGVTFGRPEEWPSQDLIGWSEEFSAALALEAYRCGVFPMPLGTGDEEMGWWSPMRRGILPVQGLHVTRSLRKNAKRYVTTVDSDPDAVLARCADPSRPHGWIDSRISTAYRELFDAGWVHTVEVWTDDGALVGGLYGVHVGGMFAGESMFHDPVRGRDASKVALIRLVTQLRAVGVGILDVQWLTEHLGSLGAYEIPRNDYLRKLAPAMAYPSLEWDNLGPVAGEDLLRAFDDGARAALQLRGERRA
ncbi:leucyl/phenylalanyl-tRNA--protein transferase [Tessaracoccus sp. MC1865]|uniref:leucyl/phenylalanyl-tRNA--protein transferase n=1 Tax=Tessaracoccus sp. MC1865 TaxID=2760310 RepID=UPI001602FB80|nr:leucyl/phenylalanyl-tRNA--protein transferase [Tessaracoccus sp. MC1865]MBB1482848.1 leucyl/phenylalanyl-tRNA--protein transferase [Tessaracoccus sp. MC1865]QTO37713.1 leucyl/phenylalanyl-tRNA--protein transferase [Tessaracoccus sp. MC1865]